MPKDNIDAAIKRAAGKDSENFAEICYEGKGPHGVLVFVEASLKRFALTQVEFTEEQLTDIEKLIDRIEDDDDVQAVYTNIA